MEIDGKKITIILPYRGSTIMRILLAITLLTVSGKHAQPDTGVLAADSKCKGGTDNPSDQCYVVELAGIHDLRTIGRAHFLWLILFVKKMESISKFRSKLENIAAEFMDTVNVGIFHCSHMAQNESAQNPCLVDMQTFFAPNAKTSVSSRLESGFYRAYNFHYLPTILSLENSTHELIEWINQAFPLPNLPLVNVDIGIEKLSFSVSFSQRLFAVLTPKELQDISFQRHLRAACHVFHPDVECYIIRVKDLSEASALHVTKSGLTLVSYPHYLDMENYVLLHFPKQNLIQTGFFDIIKWFFHDGAVPLSVGYGIGGDVADFDTSALSEDDFEDLIVEGTLEQERWLQRLQNRDRSKKANGPQSDDNHQQES